MTYTDRYSWPLMRSSRDVVIGTHDVYGEFLMTTLHYILRGSHNILTDAHDIY